MNVYPLHPNPLIYILFVTEILELMNFGFDIFNSSISGNIDIARILEIRLRSNFALN